MKKYLICFFLISLIISGNNAQKPDQLNSGEIYHALEKLNFLGTVLYVAAHPDDENTRMIAYMANEMKANTAYLSLTRGDGGQNLIGTEITEMLGVLRTNELLSARSIDGGQQFFSRAKDFGYSKNPEETLKIWNKKEVLSDVVRIIRKFKPDVIINRFDHRTPGRTHGHHTSSAMLSFEAFDLAGDRLAFDDQLGELRLWEPQRLFMNTSWWFYGSREKFAEADKSNLMGVDVGTYYPILGKSNTEIAAEARSMHKCQGFGSAGSRGSEIEYLELLKGDMPPDRQNVFDGINTTWTRVGGGGPIGEAIAGIIENYQFGDPSASIPDLLEVRSMIKKLSNKHWKEIKLAEVDRIIESALGLYLEATTSSQTATVGDEVELKVEYTNRSNVPITLKSVSINPAVFDTTFQVEMLANEEGNWFYSFDIPKRSPITSPYWLNDKASFGMYHVDDETLIGKPITPREFNIDFVLDVNGYDVKITKDLFYKFTDRAEGEVVQPFEITPEASVKIKDEIYIFADDSSQKIITSVKSGTSNVAGKVSLEIGEGWDVEPAFYDFSIEQKGDEQEFSFIVTPPTTQNGVIASAVVTTQNGTYTEELIQIDYDHIPLQTVMMPATTKLVKIQLEKEGNKIAYIEGAGDKVPESLRQVGYEVDMIAIDNIKVNTLTPYDAVVIGIRALNTKENLKYKIEELHKYVENGGNLVFQYNTTRGLKVKDFLPYPLQLSRDRVSDENAEVRVLAPEHPVMNTPNKITQKDFDGWVQERGLYFPNEWDENYTAILSSNDKGEDPKDGSLLIAPYGKGYIVYSGISWFRELPAGVPGAFRLFTNILSLGKKENDRP
jgi:LmbE family N-acetylglucosaminyl deacetylase